MNGTVLEENIDLNFKATVCNNIKIALKTFEKFKIDNEVFFSYEKNAILLGHLRTYSVERQFMQSSFVPKYSYSAYIKKVSNRGYKALILETSKFIFCVGHTSDRNRLLSQSNYKKELSINNNGYVQLTLENRDNMSKYKKYAEIAYGYKDGVLTHIDIVLPSYDHKEIEDSINLLEKSDLYDNYIPEKIKEENIVKLKNSIENEFLKIGGFNA